MAAVNDEFSALQRNNTWTLGPFNLIMSVVGCKWVFRTKFNSDGSLNKYKARLVTKGFHQIPGVDFMDTFCPVIKYATIRVIFSLAATYGWTSGKLMSAMPFSTVSLQNVFICQLLMSVLFHWFHHHNLHSYSFHYALHQHYYLSCELFIIEIWPNLLFISMLVSFNIFFNFL